MKQSPESNLPPVTTERMQCMEVWGGNRAVHRTMTTPGLRIWVFCKPYAGSEFGGDVYYLSSCASGRITRMLLADVSGHGEEVSNVAIGLRDLMRRNINYISQARFVTGMNQQFGKQNEGCQFATALVSTFFAPTGTYSLCNAGHPPPILYRNRVKRWSELSDEVQPPDTIANTPLGVTDEALYLQHDIRLESGDMVLSFSDAVTEAEDPEGRQLGYQGVLKLVSELEFSEPEDVIPALVSRISEFDPRSLERDDTTILLCQATGEGTPLTNSLLAPFRLLRQPNDNTELQ